MGPVYALCGLRLIDLSKTLDPATESRRCHLIRYNTGGPIPDFHTALDLTSHLGTHCECPYHHFEDGASVGELPLTTFMGRAIYVTLDLPENAQITGADLEKALGDRVKPGDIVLLDSPHKIPPFTPATNGPTDHRLVIGEDSEANVKPFHDILMAKNIVFLEVLKNLEYLEKDTFCMAYAPLPILGADSCPVRAFAIEGLPGFGA